jgi:hypothetical protein
VLDIKGISKANVGSKNGPIEAASEGLPMPPIFSPLA